MWGLFAVWRKCGLCIAAACMLITAAAAEDAAPSNSPLSPTPATTPSLPPLSPGSAPPRSDEHYKSVPLPAPNELGKPKCCVKNDMVPGESSGNDWFGRIKKLFGWDK